MTSGFVAACTVLILHIAHLGAQTAEYQRRSRQLSTANGSSTFPSVSHHNDIDHVTKKGTSEHKKHVWRFLSGNYEQCSLLRYNAVWFVQEPTLRGENITFIFRANRL
jgi:hypothetical protein